MSDTERMVIDVSDPNASKSELRPKFMTVNDGLLLEGKIHVEVKCEVCDSRKIVEIPKEYEYGGSLAIKFTCGRCNATQETEKFTGPVVYR